MIQSYTCTAIYGYKINEMYKKWKRTESKTHIINIIIIAYRNRPWWNSISTHSTKHLILMDSYVKRSNIVDVDADVNEWTFPGHKLLYALLIHSHTHIDISRVENTLICNCIDSYSRFIITHDKDKMRVTQVTKASASIVKWMCGNCSCNCVDG